MNFQSNYSYPLSTQVVAVGASSAATAAGVGAHIHRVRLISTTACHVKFGAAATTSDMYLAANREDYFTIKPGQTVNVIQNAAGGNLYVTELTQ